MLFEKRQGHHHAGQSNKPPGGKGKPCISHKLQESQLTKPMDYPCDNVEEPIVIIWNESHAPEIAGKVQVLFICHLCKKKLTTLQKYTLCGVINSGGHSISSASPLIQSTRPKILSISGH